jgi:hypothetical protein
MSQRNMPCPCGSGKKFKNCCGASERVTARQRGRDEDANTIVVPSECFRGKPKPVLLTEPTVEDLAPYTDEMIRALRTGYEQGLKDPCVLVIWRGGKYAQEHGLDTAPEPLVFQPISGDELMRISGQQAMIEPGGAPAMLPTFFFGLAGRDGVQISMSLDTTPSGAVLSWRYSRPFRREYAPIIGGAAVTELEQITGVGRDD